MESTMMRVFRIGLVTLSFSFLIFFSTFHLSESPAIWYDEGFFTQMAMNFSERGEQVLQVAPGAFVSGSEATAGFPLIAPVAISYSLFGVGVLEGRMVMALFLVLFGFVAYRFMATLHGAWFASWGLLILATLPTFYGNGKSVLGEVPGLTYLFLFLITILALEKRNFKSLWLWSLAGFSAGLCVTTKPVFLLLGLAVLIAWVINFKKISLTLSRVVVGVFSFGVPLGIWLYLQFGTMDSFAQILTFYANPYESTSLLSLFFTNLKRFFTEITPAYALFGVVVWTASFFVRDRIKSITVAECIVFAFASLILIAFLRLPGWYRYLFPALVPALLFAPYAGTTLYTWFSTRIHLLTRVRWLPYIMLLLLASVQLYQVGFHSYVADYYDGKRTQETQKALAVLPENESVLFYNVPEIVILLPHRNYYQFIAPHPDNLIGDEQLERLKEGTVNMVIATRAVYEKAPENFFGYSESESIGHYLILRQKLNK